MIQVAAYSFDRSDGFPLFFFSFFIQLREFIIIVEWHGVSRLSREKCMLFK